MKLTNQEKIKSFLLVYGITKDIEIEKEAEEVLLNFLQSEDLENVLLDEEGGLNFEFRESNSAPTMSEVIENIEKNKKNYE